MKHACGILPVAFSAEVHKLGVLDVYYVYTSSGPPGRSGAYNLTQTHGSCDFAPQFFASHLPSIQAKAASMEIPHERFQYLLQTNVLPCDAERAACIEELVACQKGLNAVNVSGDEATTLEDLQCRLDELRLVLSPLRKINQDILYTIFLWYVRMDHESIDAFDIRPAPWDLSLVCQSWRELALSISKLWGYLQIGAPTWRNNEKMANQMVRAKRGPFHLKIAPDTAYRPQELIPYISPEVLDYTEDIVVRGASLEELQARGSSDQEIIVLQQLNELVVVSALCDNDRRRLRTARLSLIASHLLFYQDQESAEHLEILDVSRGFRVLDRFTAPNLHYLYISDVPSASLVTSPALMLLNFIHRSNPIILSLSLVSVALTEADVSSILSMLYELGELTLYDLGWCPCKLLTHHPQTGSWNPFLTKITIPLCSGAVAMVDSRSHDDYNEKLNFPVKRLQRVEFKAPYPDDPGMRNMVSSIPENRFRHLLQSNDAPSDSERVVCLEKLSMYQNNLVVVKEVLDSLGGSAHPTRGPMQEIQRRIDGLQKIVSPFRRINQDILHDVFLYYVEADHSAKAGVISLCPFPNSGVTSNWDGPFHLKLAPESTWPFPEFFSVVEPLLYNTEDIAISSASAEELDTFSLEELSAARRSSKETTIALIECQGRCSKARFSLIPGPFVSVLGDGEEGEFWDECLTDIEITRSCYILHKFTAWAMRSLKVTDMPCSTEDRDGLAAHILISFATRSSSHLTSLTIARVPLTDLDAIVLIAGCPNLTQLTLHDLERCDYKFLTDLEHHPEIDPLAYIPFLQDVTVPLCTHTVGFVNTRSHDYGPHDFVKKLRRVHLKGPFPAGVSLLMDKMSGAVERGVQICCDL
ncbi:hypothetical protein EYR38_003171 [Pleurotus pulmonarius]|nr:hypothetical protein EYR38_003171 [Pleurotus pulmonarius]